MILNKDEINIVPFGKAKDLTGQKFNHLTVIGRDGNRTGKNIYIICECDCKEHNIISVLKDNVISNKTSSCGCVRKEKAKQHITNINNNRHFHLEGQIFGNLLVIKESEVKNRHHYWACKCLLCNKEELYLVRTDSLTSGLTTCCNKCSGHSSQGEITIENILQKNHIIYQKEKRYDTCRFRDTGAQAKFDFCIQYNDLEYLIEFDGIQHYKEQSSNHFFTTLKYIQSHDSYKNQWCKENNIPLIRIPYWHLKNLCLEDLKLETSKFII